MTEVGPNLRPTTSSLRRADFLQVWKGVVCSVGVTWSPIPLEYVFMYFMYSAMFTRPRHAAIFTLPHPLQEADMKTKRLRWRSVVITHAQDVLTRIIFFLWEPIAHQYSTASGRHSVLRKYHVQWPVLIMLPANLPLASKETWTRVLGLFT